MRRVMAWLYFLVRSALISFAFPSSSTTFLYVWYGTHPTLPSAQSVVPRNEMGAKRLLIVLFLPFLPALRGLTPSVGGASLSLLYHSISTLGSRPRSPGNLPAPSPGALGGTPSSR